MMKLGLHGGKGLKIQFICPTEVHPIPSKDGFTLIL